MIEPDTDLADFYDAHDGLPAIELAILSRSGGRPYNEDACGHWHSEEHLCCVVADGAGGHGGGEVAARTAVRYIIEHCARQPLLLPSEVEALLRRTNDEVISRRADAPGQENMHTTVVSLFIDLADGTAVWGHAGDSRLYVFRDGAMLAHTRDHSLVQTLVEAGLLKPEAVRTHPQRSELLSALGTDPVDLRLSTPTRPWTMLDGDVFLLCTDGLWEHVEEVELCASLVRSASPTAWLARLEELVLGNAARAGKVAHDNFSAIAVWVGRPAGPIA